MTPPTAEQVEAVAREMCPRYEWLDAVEARIVRDAASWHLAKVEGMDLDGDEWRDYEAILARFDARKVKGPHNIYEWLDWLEEQSAKVEGMQERIRELEAVIDELSGVPE